MAVGLRVLREGGSDELLRARIRASSERFDDEYFKLDEDEGEERKRAALHIFAKARAMSALAFALAEDASQLHEAIYEALSALVDDSSAVVHAVETTLRTSDS